MNTAEILQGDCLEVLGQLQDESVQCCVTSPPYFGLRDYGTAQWEGGDGECDHRIPSGEHDPKRGKGRDETSSHTIRFQRESCFKCGAVRVDSQIGLEETPDAYVAKLVAVFREVRRVLKKDGTLWLNLGDSYCGYKGTEYGKTKGNLTANTPIANNTSFDVGTPHTTGLKPKDLIGIPWRVAFALQADGWYLRQDIIWCLSGGTWLYVKSQKGEMPMTVKDLSRLDPSTVKLWNGDKWTQLLGMNKSKRRGDELEIVLRSGERISCTPTHKFPTCRGLIEASDLAVGDVLQSCRLPEPIDPRDCVIDNDAAWFAGLYLAEGSRSGDKIQIAGHSKESERWQRVRNIAFKFGGSATMSQDGNTQSIRVYGKVLNAIIDELVGGRTAHDKCFAVNVWRYSDDFIESMLDGYLSGDGHWDGSRWRLVFCRNYNLERDLRTVCARLGYTLTLNLATVPYEGKSVQTFRGEIRKARSGHHNQLSRNEIVEIRKSRCRNVYDLGVADEPHLFALASGILTHNSKPNPMPESVKDRCTKSHEYIFLLSKSAKYFYDAEAIAEPVAESTIQRVSQDVDNQKGSLRVPGKTNGAMKAAVRFGGNKYGDSDDAQHRTKSGNVYAGGATRNKRSVWTFSSRPFKEAHFATFPPELPKLCIKAGSQERDTVLDPFNGSGTTGLVACALNRNYIGIELNKHYVEMSKTRIKQASPLFTEVRA